jgi:hypothetical protein
MNSAGDLKRKSLNKLIIEYSKIVTDLTSDLKV